MKLRTCACGCGRTIVGRQTYFPLCYQRVASQRALERARQRGRLSMDAERARRRALAGIDEDDQPELSPEEIERRFRAALVEIRRAS